MDNFTRAVRFEKADYIPMTFSINNACQHHYPKEALWDLMEQHKLLFPNFRRSARDAGVPIHMHSDGDIRTLADDLIDSGVEILNLQDRVNGIDWIAQKFQGKLCVEVDIDRQSVTPFGTPTQIDQMILDTVSKISTPDGGLCLIYGLYPGIPLESIKALMDAMEKYAFYHG